jgi:hypothetical protein
MRCLDKDPARRFPDVAAFVAAIGPFGPAPGLEGSLNPRMSSINPAAAPPVVRDPTGVSGAAWDATGKDEIAAKGSGQRRVMIALLGAAAVVLLAALVASRRSGDVIVSAAAPRESAAPPPASAPAQPEKQALKPSDLPDIEPSAAPLPSVKPASLPSVTAVPVKKPKPTASADPFGGRRN